MDGVKELAVWLSLAILLALLQYGISTREQESFGDILDRPITAHGITRSYTPADNSLMATNATQELKSLTCTQLHRVLDSHQVMTVPPPASRHPLTGITVDEWVAKTEPAHAKLHRKHRRKTSRKSSRRRPPSWLEGVLLKMVFVVVHPRITLTHLCIKMLLKNLQIRAVVNTGYLGKVRRLYYKVLHRCLKTAVHPLLFISGGYGAPVIEMLLMLSGDVERNPGPTTLTVNDLREVKRAVYAARTKWRDLGLELGLPVDILDEIEERTRDSGRQLEDMLKNWLQKPSLNPSWESLAEALKSEIIGQEYLADDIVKKYCTCTEAASGPSPEGDLTPPAEPSTTVQPPTENYIQTYANYLRSVYTCSEFPVYSKWPPTQSTNYISLATISKENITKEQADEFTKATLHGDVDQILKKKEAIKMEDILVPESGVKPKCVLVEGAPGVGKTTFSWEVCKNWAKGEMFQEFSTVVLLKMRDEWVQCAKDVSDLFYYDSQEVQKKVSNELIRSRGKEVLIILDGMDELPSHLLKQRSVFGQLLSGTSLPLATILVTSRPSVTHKLLSTWPTQVSRHIEVLGFTKEKIQDYARSVLPPEHLPDFRKYLSMHRHIQTMMYIPLNSAIVVEIYKHSRRLNKRTPVTATQLYTDLAYALLLRHLDDHPEYKDQELELNKFSDLPPPVGVAFTKLCEIAYHRLMKQEIIFSDLGRSFNHLGFMNSSNEGFGPRRVSVSYSFLHLSIQEYLAAVHVDLQMSTEQQMELFKDSFKHEHLQNFWRYVFGLTQLKGFDFTMVRKYLSEDDGTFTTQQPLELLYEMQEPQCLAFLGESVISTLGLSLSPGSAAALAHCIVHSKCSWKLSLCVNDETAEILTSGLSQCGSSRTGCILSLKWRYAALQHLTKVSQNLLAGITELYYQPLHKDICTPASLAVISPMTKLKSLHLFMVRLDHDSPEASSHISRLNFHFSTLQELRVTSSTIGTTGAIFLQHLIQSTDKLEMLDLSDSELPLNGTVILEGLHRDTPLQKLNLFGCNIISPTAKALSKVLEVSSSLSSVILKSCGTGGEEPLHLAKLLPSSGIESLDDTKLLRNPWTEMSLDVKSSGFQLNPWVEESPRKATITIAMLHHNSPIVLTTPREVIWLNSDMIELLCQHNTLTVLDMSNRSMCDEEAITIAEALRNHNALRTLNISSNSMGDKGAAAIAEAVHHNNTLTTLNMSNNSVGDEGAAAMVEALCHNSTLHYLDMSWYSTSEKGATSMAEALPIHYQNTLTQLDTTLDETGHVEIKNEVLYHVNTKVNFTTCSMAETLHALRHNTALTTLKMTISVMERTATATVCHNTLTTLKISNGAKGVTAMVEALHNNNTVTTLDMSHNSVSLIAEGATAIAEALRHNNTLTTLDISYNSVRVTNIAEALHHNNTLTTLDISYNSVGVYGTMAMAEALRHNDALTTLNMSVNSVGAKGATAMAEALRHNNTLTTLNMYSNSVGAEGATAMAEALCHNSTLTILDMSYNSVGAEGATAMAEALCHNNALITLNMRSNSVGAEGATTMAAALRHNNTLTTLNMSLNSVGAEGATAMAEALRHNNTLTTLNMSENSVGAEGATAMAEAICHNSTLTTLHMTRSSVGAEGATAMAEAICHNSTLTTLHMSSNSVGDEGATAMAEALRHNNTLTTLNMSDNSVGGEGATAMAEALRHNNTITTLDMSSNSVGDKGATAMAEALRHNNTLTRLDMSRNSVGAEGTTAMAEALCHNNTLTTLYMSHNSVGDEGATAMAEALRHNNTLTTLDMSYNSVGAEGATVMAKALRHNSTLTTLDMSGNPIGPAVERVMADLQQYNTALQVVLRW